MGYTTEPYMFYLEAGENTITLASIKEPMIIDQISVVSVVETPKYETYLENLKATYGEPSLKKQTTGPIQAEKHSTNLLQHCMQLLTVLHLILRHLV